MKRAIAASLAMVGALLLPAVASAATTAYTSRTVNMRAGPGTDYPVVTRIRDDSRLRVYGCVRDYRWCDASYRGIRGWVNSARLEFAYQGRRVLVPANYRYFDAPIISFNFGYWDRYYQDRPFFRERSRWDRNWRGRRDRDGERDGQRGDWSGDRDGNNNMASEGQGGGGGGGGRAGQYANAPDADMPDANQGSGEPRRRVDRRRDGGNEQGGGDGAQQAGQYASSPGGETSGDGEEPRRRGDRRRGGGEQGGEPCVTPNGEACQ